MEDVVGEVVGKHPTLEQVNQLMLDRLYTLIKDADPESIATLTESLAKYNSSIRNNTVFTPEESSADMNRRQAGAVMGDLLKGE